MSSTMKRLRSVVVMLILVASTNFAISLTNKTGVTTTPDMPRPKTGVTITPDMPRPKTGVTTTPDMPRPKTGVTTTPDMPRP